MSHIDTESFRLKLLELQSELEELASISEASTATVILDQSSVGRLSRMDALQGQQMALETERRRRQQLVQISAALMRIKNGEFGYCCTCGEDIAQGRLAVNPIALHCMSCSK